MTNEHAGHNPVFHEHDGNDGGLIDWLGFLEDSISPVHDHGWNEIFGDGFLGVFLIYIWKHCQHKKKFILITLIFG